MKKPIEDVVQIEANPPEPTSNEPTLIELAPIVSEAPQEGGSFVRLPDGSLVREEEA